MAYSAEFDFTPGKGGNAAAGEPPFLETGGGAAPAKASPRPLGDPEAFFRKITKGKSILELADKHTIVSQGDAADWVVFIRQGRVKLTVVSNRGKEAVIGLLEPGLFFGEESLSQPHAAYLATATTMGTTTVVRIQKDAIAFLLQDEPDFADLFISHLVARNVRVHEDLVDQLFHTAEKRLARVLLRLAHYGKEGPPQPVIGRISQETLAQMIGADRSRVSSFMNKFKSLGYISYDHDDGVRVYSSLLDFVIQD